MRLARRLAPRTWYYDPAVSRRDLRLDFLRGICLFKMVFDHLWRTPLHGYEDYIGFVTAAEGFFLISGVVLAIVYGRRIERHGLAPSSRMLLSRAGKLYLANLVLVLVFAGLELADWIPFRAMRRDWDGVPGVMDLLHFNQPYYLHVLPRYVVFLAFAPLGLWLLERRKTLVFLAATVGLYLWNLDHLGSIGFLGLEPGRSAFPVLSWQLLFFVGMVLGHHRERLARVWRRVPTWVWALLFVAGAIGFALFKVAFREGMTTIPAGEIRIWFGRIHLGPGRLLNLAAVFGLSYLAVDRFWKPLNAAFGRLMLAYGQSSLYVFLVHIVLAWGLSVAHPDRWPVVDTPVGLVILDLAVITLIWWMVEKRFLFRLIPR